MTLSKNFGFLVLLLSLIAGSCKDDNGDGGTNCTSSVAQEALLQDYASSIQSQLAALDLQVDRMLTEAAAFRDDSTNDFPGSAISAVIDVHQQVALNEPAFYGPNNEFSPRRQINPFPLDQSTVDAYLGGEAFDPEAESNFDRGFAALYYLAFSPDDQTVRQRFQSNPEARELFYEFALDLSNEIKAVINAWDVAAPTFAQRTGTGAGSGLTVLINNLSQQFEDSRRDRLGTPVGITLGIPVPNAVEIPNGSYNNTGILVEASLAGSQLFFTGIDASGVSLEDYLRGLENPEGAELADDIIAQFVTSFSELRDLDADIRSEVTDNRDEVLALYAAMSRIVVFLKTDLPSVACVPITYVDNPSDSD